MRSRCSWYLLACVVCSLVSWLFWVPLVCIVLWPKEVSCSAPFTDEACHMAPRWQSCHLDPGNFCSKVHALFKLLFSNMVPCFVKKNKIKNKNHCYDKWKTEMVITSLEHINTRWICWEQSRGSGVLGGWYDAVLPVSMTWEIFFFFFFGACVVKLVITFP